MKCPKCDAEIKENIKECPYCKTIFNIENEKTEKQNNGTGCLIVFFVIFLLIFVPILIGVISNNIENSNKVKHEQRLIEDGKIKTHNEVINEILEILKSRNETKLKEYLADDFTYYDNNNIEHKYLSSFFEDLKIFHLNYEIEQRGNDIKNQETYRIYWNVIEENKKRGIKKQEQYYCLQKITIILERAVKADEITYEIKKIILTDN